jgi:NADPH-dependent ferric siderophore reductase
MPERQRPAPRVTRVVRTERLSESMVRVVVTADDWSGFEPAHADAYVKVVFDDPADPEHPRLRTYTVRDFDAEAGELTLDFVVHGDSGLAGPWAAAVEPGAEMVIRGPGGGYVPDADADFHVLVGDESALPAIAAALEQLPDGAAVHAFVEVHGPGDEIALPAPVTWLHRGPGPVGSRLVETVTAFTPPAGDGHWFVHGEAGVVKALRRHLRVELGLPMDRLSISGYWRLGVDDEGWRAVKRDWNREVEESEAAAVS